jgi:hypothetical protein
VKLVFIDETENSTHVPGFYAVCAVAVDATKYKTVRQAIDDALTSSGWCRDHEFKGSVIFSSSKGDATVSTEKRVDAASSMVSATVSKANSRAVPAVAWSDTGGGAAAHIELLGRAVAGCLKAKPAGKNKGKDLCIVFADKKAGIGRAALSEAVKTAVASRGYCLAEDVVVVTSSCDWPGVLLADVVAYLAMWTYAVHKLGGGQIGLFDEEAAAPSEAVVRKMAKVQEMLESGSDVRFLPTLPHAQRLHS